jgi:serine/threonine-protein kinase
VAAGFSTRVLAGRYQLEREIGRGGMGTVWAARDLELGTDVAIKLMAPARVADPAARARFRREAQAAALLKSEHIVSVHDFGEDEGMPFLVMERLRGETVAELLARRGRLELREAVALIGQACTALGLAHAASVVHRDIKPSNLFVTSVDGRPSIKVLDFGVARGAGLDACGTTHAGSLVGSLSFMSPEQANGEPPGPLTDLWGVAAVLYLLLTGVEAFRGSGVDETLTRIRDGKFTPPSRRCPELPPSVDEFFRRAFEVDATARFQSARELAEALAELPADRAASRRATPLQRPRYRANRGVALPRRFWSRVAVYLLLPSIVAIAFAARAMNTPKPKPPPDTLDVAPRP